MPSETDSPLRGLPSCQGHALALSRTKHRYNRCGGGLPSLGGGLVPDHCRLALFVHGVIVRP